MAAAALLVLFQLRLLLGGQDGHDLRPLLFAESPHLRPVRFLALLQCLGLRAETLADGLNLRPLRFGQAEIGKLTLFLPAPAGWRWGGVVRGWRLPVTGRCGQRE